MSDKLFLITIHTGESFYVVSSSMDSACAKLKESFTFQFAGSYYTRKCVEVKLLAELGKNLLITDQDKINE